MHHSPKLFLFIRGSYSFLNSGVMFASFHSEGTIPSSSDKLEEGIVPSEWKEANITPLFKKE